MLYYLEAKPTAERRDEIRRRCEEEADKVKKVVGMACWYEQFDKVLTAEESATLRRLFADERNPGTVTMVWLFLEWMR